MARRILGMAAWATLVACGGDPLEGDPTDVVLGETTFVVVVNPSINGANDASVPAPGPTRSDVRVSEQELAASTGATGIAVLSPVSAGEPHLWLEGDGIDGGISQAIRERDLVELALAAEGGQIAEMARVVYAFGGQVVDVEPDASVDAVNDAISASDRIVLLAGGVYDGDLEFSGSQVTLFGAGSSGGEVTIRGDVIVSGSGNRIRGARIEGQLTISGSDAGLSFSTLTGDVEISGSDSVLLENSFCAGLDISGSGTVALGNRGLDDPRPADCP